MKKANLLITTTFMIVFANSIFSQKSTGPCLSPSDVSLYNDMVFRVCSDIEDGYYNIGVAVKIANSYNFISALHVFYDRHGKCLRNAYLDVDGIFVGLDPISVDSCGDFIMFKIRDDLNLTLNSDLFKKDVGVIAKIGQADSGAFLGNFQEAHFVCFEDTIHSDLAYYPYEVPTPYKYKDFAELVTRNRDANYRDKIEATFKKDNIYTGHAPFLTYGGDSGAPIMVCTKDQELKLLCIVSGIARMQRNARVFGVPLIFLDTMVVKTWQDLPSQIHVFKEDHHKSHLFGIAHQKFLTKNKRHDKSNQHDIVAIYKSFTKFIEPQPIWLSQSGFEFAYKRKINKELQTIDLMQRPDLRYTITKSTYLNNLVTFEMLFEPFNDKTIAKWTRILSNSASSSGDSKMDLELKVDNIIRAYTILWNKLIIDSQVESDIEFFNSNPIVERIKRHALKGRQKNGNKHSRKLQNDSEHIIALWTEEMEKAALDLLIEAVDADYCDEVFNLLHKYNIYESDLNCLIHFVELRNSARRISRFQRRDNIDFHPTELELLLNKYKIFSEILTAFLKSSETESQLAEDSNLRHVYEKRVKFATYYLTLFENGIDLIGRIENANHEAWSKMKVKLKDLCTRFPDYAAYTIDTTCKLIHGYSSTVDMGFELSTIIDSISATNNYGTQCHFYSLEDIKMLEQVYFGPMREWYHDPKFDFSDENGSISTHSNVSVLSFKDSTYTFQLSYLLDEHDGWLGFQNSILGFDPGKFYLGNESFPLQADFNNCLLQFVKALHLGLNVNRDNTRIYFLGTADAIPYKGDFKFDSTRLGDRIRFFQTEVWNLSDPIWFSKVVSEPELTVGSRIRIPEHKTIVKTKIGNLHSNLQLAAARALFNSNFLFQSKIFDYTIDPVIMIHEYPFQRGPEYRYVRISILVELNEFMTNKQKEIACKESSKKNALYQQELHTFLSSLLTSLKEIQNVKIGSL